MWSTKAKPTRLDNEQKDYVAKVIRTIQSATHVSAKVWSCVSAVATVLCARENKFAKLIIP